MKRKIGYYWVKIKSGKDVKWRIAEYCDGDYWLDRNFIKIHEKQITRT